MFDISPLSPFVDRIMSFNASIFPHIFDVVVMHVVFEGGLFEFVLRRCMENCMVLCDSHQYWF